MHHFVSIVALLVLACSAGTASELILSEFDGSPPGPWRRHAGGYLGSGFSFSAESGVLRLTHATGPAAGDSDSRDCKANHHLTRTGLAIDPNRPYEIDVSFRFLDRPGFEEAVESFCINALVQTNPGNRDGELRSHDDADRTIEAWALNIDTISGGVTKYMGFIDELTAGSEQAYGPEVSGHATASFAQFGGTQSLPAGHFTRSAMRNKWYRFRVQVHKRLDGSTRRGWLTYHMWDDQGVLRASGESDHSRHPFKPRYDNYATIGLNSHFAHWEARNLQVSYLGAAIADGLGPIDPDLYNGGGDDLPRDAFQRIEAEDYASQSGIGVWPIGGGERVGEVNDGDWCAYGPIDFGSTGIAALRASVSSGSIGGTVECRVDGINGPLVASIQVPATGGWNTFVDVEAAATQAGRDLRGQHDCWLVFTGGSGYLFDVDWFIFDAAEPEPEPQPGEVRIEAEEYDSMSGIGVWSGGTGMRIGIVDDGDWCRYDGIDFGAGGISAVTANVSSATVGGRLEFRLDAVDGDLIAWLDVPGTGAWSNYQVMDVSVTTAGTTVAGLHDLVLVFTGDSGLSLFDLDYVAFTRGGEVEPQPLPDSLRIEAEDYDSMSGIGVWSGGTGMRIGIVDDGDWCRYDGIDFGAGGISAVTANVSSATVGGRLEFRLDAVDGDLIAWLDVPGTGAWSNYQVMDVSVTAAGTTVAGLHDLVLVFTGDSGLSLFDLDYVAFTRGGEVEPQPEPEPEPQPEPTLDPILFLTFDGDALDLSGNGHDGSLVGDAAWQSGMVAQAVAFDGAGDAVLVVDAADLRFTSADSYTLAAWVHVPALPGRWTGIVTKGRDSASRSWYGLWISHENRWVAGAAGNGITGPVVSTGWHHVVIVQDAGAGTRCLYVDGVEVASGTPGNGDGEGALWIGGAEGVSEDFAGAVDELQLFDQALNEDDVLALGLSGGNG